MERPSLTRVFCGAGLVLLTLLTLLSLASHDPLDPPDPSYWTREAPRTIQNKCGIVGAYLSGTLIGYVGRPASCLLVVLGLLWIVLFFSPRKLEQPWVRLIGILLLVTCVSTLFAPEFGRGNPTDAAPVVVGDAVANLLYRALSYHGSLILVLTVGVLSLLLATDMLLWQGTVWLVTRGPGWTTRAMRRFFQETHPAVEEEPAPEDVPVRRKRRAEPEAEEPEEEAPVPEPKRAAVETAGRPGEVPQFVGAESHDAAGRVKVEVPDIEDLSVALGAGGRTDAEEEEYELPGLDLLDEPIETDPSRYEHFIQEKARVLERCLSEFGISVKVVSIDTGPVVTLYELELAPGIKVGRIIGLSDDIAMALKAPNVRIVAPIPGKSTVGVEVPNLDKEFVRLAEIMEESRAAESRHAIPMYLGKDAAGAPLVCDMTSLPHLLIAGETGSGKSVCINAIILSVLMTRSPHQVRLLLVDPKMVELACFKDIPHLLCPVVTDMKKAAGILEWAESKMDERYEFLSMANVRNIAAYNRLGEAEIRERYGIEPDEEVDTRHCPFHLPYILIVIDELADLMLMASKEIETSITRLAQKSRAVGIHIILATQRPSVDVITGLIKSNLPARIGFRVASKVDSRTILDQNGADKLLGSGDMLFLQPGTSKLIRAQGTYISEEEIARVGEFVRAQRHPDFSRELVKMQKGEGPAGGSRDPLYDDAVRVVLESQRGSVSLLQRKLEIGYSRAARLVDFMAEDGIVGSYKGSQAREVLYTLEEWEERLASQGES
ncbi:MAG TPA: DNA translocase FtsK 4TM domain-containing protein [Planctomycetota bacterium]|nr:DNA translocase FtsK 4TM domain-containing protein [Planctomycetota bacterium]